MPPASAAATLSVATWTSDDVDEAGVHGARPRHVGLGDLAEPPNDCPLVVRAEEERLATAQGHLVTGVGAHHDLATGADHHACPGTHQLDAIRHGVGDLRDRER